MTHKCHAIGCTISVPPAMFMCKKHWYMLPAEMRGKIYQLYRKGQEIDKLPSTEYLEYAGNCIVWLHNKEKNNGQRNVQRAHREDNTKPFKENPLVFVAKHFIGLRTNGDNAVADAEVGERNE